MRSIKPGHTDLDVSPIALGYEVVWRVKARGVSRTPIVLTWLRHNHVAFALLVGATKSRASPTTLP